MVIARLNLICGQYMSYTGGIVCAVVPFIQLWRLLVADWAQTTLAGREHLEKLNWMKMLHCRRTNAKHRGDVQDVLCCFYFELMTISSTQQDCNPPCVLA